MLISVLLAGAMAAAPKCTPASGDASAILRRAADALGMNRTDGRVLRFAATDIVAHDYESDRPDPPYLMQPSRLNGWIDPATGVVRTTTTETMVGGQQFGGATLVTSPAASFTARDTTLLPVPQAQTAIARPLDAWAVVADWRAADDVRVAERCELRDYPRVVLTRTTTAHPSGERLYVDPKSGYPVALEWREPHYLWGQSIVQYQYATWKRVGDAHMPGTAARLVDGFVEVTRSFGNSALVPKDSAPSFAIPATRPPASASSTPAYLAPTAVDTVRISPTTFLLRNPGYTETMTLARDTVFIFDATQGDARARQDSAWIGKLFPGKHPVAVVVTDLAFPHVAGVRYWVAHGATIVSHRASRPFLEKVVARKWTDKPDALEEQRKGGRAVAMKFRAVNDSAALAGGAITVFAIDGPSSEGALAAFVRSDDFLWASDYIQSATRPTQYLDEVAAAVARMGITPARVAAEHLPVVDWSRLLELTKR